MSSRYDPVPDMADLIDGVHELASSGGDPAVLDRLLTGPYARLRGGLLLDESTAVLSSTEEAVRRGLAEVTLLFDPDDDSGLDAAAAAEAEVRGSYQLVCADENCVHGWDDCWEPRVSDRSEELNDDDSEQQADAAQLRADVSAVPVPEDGELRKLEDHATYVIEQLNLSEYDAGVLLGKVLGWIALANALGVRAHAAAVLRAAGERA